MIDLGKGHPDTRLLPIEAFGAAAAPTSDRHALQYTDRRGPSGFRGTLATWLTRRGLGPVSEDGLCVTAGASHALDLVARALGTPGGVVLVEEPTYFLALPILRGRGLRPVAVPLDAEGPRLDTLLAALEAHRPALFYGIPTFHNPTGITWSGARRRAVAKACAAAGTTLVADEVYPLLHFSTPPPPPMRHFDPDIVSLGSFSKIFGPGLRLGWISAPPQTIGRVVDCPVLSSGGCIAPVTATVATRLIADGHLDTALDTFRTTYARRARALLDALAAHTPLQVTAPAGGFFVWTTLPGSRDAEALLPRAHAAGVGFRPGHRFSASGDLRDHVRLAYSRYTEDELVEAARRLGGVLTTAAEGR